MTTADGLRERKKAETRRALSAAAVQLCLERGYHHVTVADIADAVGVSRRTFSNYFPGKAECVTAFGESVLEEILDVVAEAPAGTTLEHLLRMALVGFADRLNDGLDGFVLLVQLEPELQAASLAADAAMVDRVAVSVAGLAGLDEDDIRVTAFAAAAAQAIRTTGDRWIARGRPGGRNGLIALLDDVFTLFDLTALRR